MEKKYALAVIATIVIICLIIGWVVYEKYHSKKKPHKPKPKPTPVANTCAQESESCKRNEDCCENTSCKSGVCRKDAITEPINSFHMKLNGNNIGLNTITNTISVLSDSSSTDWNTVWDWDGNYLLYREIKQWENKTHYVKKPELNKPLQLSKKKTTEVIINRNGGSVGIFSSDWSMCTQLNNNNELVWKKCVDGNSIMFDIDVNSVVCKNAGQTCLNSTECCQPGSCVDGVCITCVGEPKACQPSEKAVCDSTSASWKCVSQCDDKDRGKCDESESSPSCSYDETTKTWKWTCVSECNHLDRPNCAKSSCVKKGDSFVYQCDTTCDNNILHSTPPTTPEDCTVVDKNKCISDDSDHICYECHTTDESGKPVVQYKSQSFNCATSAWDDAEQACSTDDKPQCNSNEEPVCITMNPAFCGGKTGKKWVCPSDTSDWCGVASLNDLVQLNVCKDSPNDTCNTVVYTTRDGVPIFPTVSYENCSLTSANTKHLGNATQNPAGYLDRTGSKPVLYSSDKNTMINGKKFYYSDKYAYYTPKNVSENLDPPMCLMKLCDSGVLSIKPELQISGHANFSNDDPRVAGNNGPPVKSDLSKVGTCVCANGKVGYNCDTDPIAYCNNKGVGTTSTTQSVPNPGVVCACSGTAVGPTCEKDNSYCNNHGVVSYVNGVYSCKCDSGYQGERCDVVFTNAVRTPLGTGAYRIKKGDMYLSIGYSKKNGKRDISKPIFWKYVSDKKDAPIWIYSSVRESLFVMALTDSATRSFATNGGWDVAPFYSDNYSYIMTYYGGNNKNSYNKLVSPYPGGLKNPKPTKIRVAYLLTENGTKKYGILFGSQYQFAFNGNFATGDSNKASLNINKLDSAIPDGYMFTFENVPSVMPYYGWSGL